MNGNGPANGFAPGMQLCTDRKIEIKELILLYVCVGSVCFAKDESRDGPNCVANMHPFRTAADR